MDPMNNTSSNPNPTAGAMPVEPIANAGTAVSDAVNAAETATVNAAETAVNAVNTAAANTAGAVASTVETAAANTAETIASAAPVIEPPAAAQPTTQPIVQPTTEPVIAAPTFTAPTVSGPTMTEPTMPEPVAAEPAMSASTFDTTGAGSFGRPIEPIAQPKPAFGGGAFQPSGFDSASFGTSSSMQANNPFAAASSSTTPSVSFNDPAAAAQPQPGTVLTQSGQTDLTKKKSNKTTLIALTIVAGMIVVGLAIVLILQLTGSI